MLHSHTRSRSAPVSAVKSLCSLLLVPLAVLLCASAARAIPITITGGRIGTPAGLGNFSATLTAPNFGYSASDTSAPKQQLCGPCTPGNSFPTTVNVNLPTSGFFAVTYNGVTYGGGLGITEFGGITITLPPLTIPNGGTVVAPFIMSGTLNARLFDGSPPLTFELMGSGTATFTFFCPNRFGGCTLGETSFTFNDPSAVPEPATLVLLGTGLAGVAAKARRRRRRRGA